MELRDLVQVYNDKKTKDGYDFLGGEEKSYLFAMKIGALGIKLTI